MNQLLKKHTIFLLFYIIFSSCESFENEEKIISGEEIISTDLTDKIIATATSVNDYNLLNFDCLNQFDDESIIFYGHFMNPEGVGRTFALPYHRGFWELRYNSIKETAFIETGIEFSDDDFFITSIDIIGGTLFTKENFIDFFEDCSFDEDFIYDDAFVSLELSEVNFDCDGAVYFNFVDNYTADFLADTNGLFELSQGISGLESELITFNTINNTSYTLDDIRLIGLPGNTVNTINNPPTDTGQDFLIGFLGVRGEEIIMNYFDGCSYEKPFEKYDVLNFEFPLQINRYSIELEEVITYTAETNEDIIEIFSEDIGELTFEYPISLLAQNGTILTIESNEELETTFNNSLEYANY